MAEIDGNLWEYNLVKVLIIDVSDDYRLMASPMPSEFYPVLQEMWLPAHRIDTKLVHEELLQGYLYDWHERPSEQAGEWYVGVVDSCLASALLSAAK